MLLRTSRKTAAHLACSIDLLSIGVNIKSVGVPTAAEEVTITQGSLEDACCVVAYGKAGQLVAAVGFNQAKRVEFYQHLIEQAAAFPPKLPGVEQPPLHGCAPGRLSRSARAQP